MADVNLFSSFAGSGTIDVLIWTVLVILIVGIVFMLGYIMWLIKQYNIELEIMDETSAGRIIYKDKARNYRSKDGRSGWELLKSKGHKKKRLIINEVPKEYIDLTKRGKKFVRLKRLEGDILKPWHPNVQDISDKDAIKMSLPTGQREAVINEVVNAEIMHGQKSIGQIIMQFMPYILILMMVFSMVILLDQIGETMGTISGQLNAVQKEATAREEIFKETQERLINFVEGKQIIDNTKKTGEAPN